MSKYEIRVLNDGGKVLDHLKGVSVEVLDRAIESVEERGYAVRVQYRKTVRRGAKPQVWTAV